MDEHPTSLLEAYALGALSPESAEQVRAHVRGCNACQRHVRSAGETLSLLAYAAPSSPLPEGAEDRFMVRIADLRAEQTPPEARARQPLQRLPQRARRYGPWAALGLIAAALLVTFFALRGGASTSDLTAAEQQARALLGAPQPTIFHLEATKDGPPGAVAVMAMDPSTGQGVLVTRRLPPLGPGQTYEFWIVHTPQGAVTSVTSSVGVFTGNGGAGTLRFTTSLPPSALQNAGVTIEPSGGVTTPDAPMLLRISAAQAPTAEGRVRENGEAVCETSGGNTMSALRGKCSGMIGRLRTSARA